jgi:diguanylate cyclase (GGDEF)-like protein/PAS domain S-box-containing protein
VLNNQGEAEDYIFLEVNNAFEEMTGLNRELILNKRVTEVLPGIRTGRFNWVSFYGEVALTGVKQEFTQFADVLERFYKVTAFSPEKEYFVTIFQDITSEMKNIQKLENQKQEIENISKDLNVIFNSTHDAIFLVEIKDEEFRYIRNNTAHQIQTGLSLESIQYKTPVEVMGENYGGILETNYKRCVETGKTITYEQNISFPTGNKIWVNSLTPVYENETVRYLVGSGKDISDLKNLQKENDVLLERLQAMFDKHIAAMLIIEPITGKIVDANPSACDFYGYTREEILNLYIQDINVLPKEEVEKRWLKALTAKEKHFVFPHKLKSGEIRLVDAYSCPITYGTETQMFSIIFDVTDREKYKEDLFCEKELLSTTLHSIGDGVVVTDTDGIITSLNKAACEITGWRYEEAKNKLFTEVFKLKSEKTHEMVDSPVAKVLQAGKIVGLANHTVLINKEGHSTPIADSAAPIRNEKGQTFGVVMVFRDVSKDKEQQEEIVYLSYHDHLTGLYNRRFTEEEMNRLEFARQLPFAVIMGDVNGLKITNDVFGHETGDKLLQKVALALKENCRIEDIISRWGGDEFLILLPHTSIETADKIIQKIKISCASQNEGSLQISISLGCAVKKKGEESLQRVLQEAEELMYHEKLLEGKSYRNSVINTLLATLNEKSMETEEHAERLKVYCYAIAKKLQLSAQEMNKLSLLAILHDIGKVGINQSILQKPGALTPQEWDEMKKHPEIGYRIAQSAPELSEVAEYILSHHERWDGKGYPSGTKGEDIPLLCRILSVADAYDAVTNDRVYRKALGKSEAIAELTRNTGTQFDPKIVDVFVKLSSCAW